MDNYDIHPKKRDEEAERESIVSAYSNTREQSFEVIEMKSEKSENKNMLNDDLLKEINNKYTFYKKYGNLITFLQWKGEPIIVIGPHWPFFVCFFGFMTLVASMFFFVLWQNLMLVFKLIGVFTYFIYAISYLLTAFSNPGIPKKDLWVDKNCVQSNLKNFRVCIECKVIMNIDENTTHCEDCNMCIEGYDHHCPWTSKCIGKGNLKVFYVFVISSLVEIGYFICAAISLSFNQKY